ncbi:MAG: 3-deoxy-7-phosphoheptulonate synthase [Christensenellaceae bacterium]
MIVVMQQTAQKGEIEDVKNALVQKGMQVQENAGVECTVLGVLGDTYTVDKELVGLMAGVERVVSVQEPYKKANRKFHPDDTVIEADGRKIGGGSFAVIAGPCSVESSGQLLSIANSVNGSGATFLRGGAFKPRSSPYSFQGLGETGLDILKGVREVTGIPFVTEIMSPKHVEMFADSADIIQVGARNMQNFDLLKELGQAGRPILLKRGLSSTVEEWLMSAEYIISAGNEDVILCERGIRTFETYTRNTLDISAIPAIKKLSHLPVVVDPSHASGLSYMVESLSLAAVAAGADGLMIEVHNDPKHALCDGAQSITPEQFGQMMHKVHALRAVV